MSAKKFWASLTLAALSTSLITACSDDNKNSNGTANVSAADVKSNYVKMAYAAYSDSLSTAQDLQTAVDAFLAAPDQTKLDAARSAYKASRKPYQQSEIMRWDESITNGQDLTADGGIESVDAWEGQVNAWPLDETLIESLIAGTDTIDKDLLIDNFGAGDNEANVTTGIHAIEFMLWDRDVEARGPGSRNFTAFKSNTDCAAEVTASEQCRNALYLKTATDLLVEDLTAMKAEWSSSAANTQGTLAYNFLNSNAAIDYVVQAIGNMAVGELGGARLASGLWRPLAGVTFKEGDFEEEHDCFSDLSHVAVYYNFQAIRNAFYGSYTALDGSVISGASLGDYIKSVDSNIYSQLDTILNNTQTQMRVVFDAGENGTTFDQIIADSKTYYEAREAGTTPLPAKSAALVAIEEAILQLSSVENIVIDLAEALSLTAVDGDAIGETD